MMGTPKASMGLPLKNFQQLMEFPPYLMMRFQQGGTLAYRMQNFSCSSFGLPLIVDPQATPLPQATSIVKPDVVAQPNVVVQPDVVVQLVVAEASKKRGASKKWEPKEAKKAKPTKKVVELNDDEDGKEGSSGSRWSDTEVQNIIHWLTLMDKQFAANAKKQGEPNFILQQDFCWPLAIVFQSSLPICLTNQI